MFSHPVPTKPKLCISLLGSQDLKQGRENDIRVQGFLLFCSSLSSIILQKASPPLGMRLELVEFPRHYGVTRLPRRVLMGVEPRWGMCQNTFFMTKNARVKQESWCLHYQIMYVPHTHMHTACTHTHARTHCSFPLFSPIFASVVDKFWICVPTQISWQIMIPMVGGGA